MATSSLWWNHKGRSRQVVRFHIKCYTVAQLMSTAECIKIKSHSAKVKQFIFPKQKEYKFFHTINVNMCIYLFLAYIFYWWTHNKSLCLSLKEVLKMIRNVLLSRTRKKMLFSSVSHSHNNCCLICCSNTNIKLLR